MAKNDANPYFGIFIDKQLISLAANGVQISFNPNNGVFRLRCNDNEIFLSTREIDAINNYKKSKTGE